MDSLTHIVLGACIGEAFLGRHIGKKALIWGAISQSLPDIDVLAALWMDPATNLLAHRGFTHSLLFAAIAFPLLSVLADRWHRPHNVSMRQWLWFFSTEIVVHDLLDGFNVYGTGWLEPFSHYRFSLNALFVADPLFSIFPAIAFVMLLVLKGKDRRRKIWCAAGIAGSFLYLIFCLNNKLIVERDVRTILRTQHVPYTRYMTAPTPFNNLLWYIVAGNDKGYYVGFHSVFDRKKQISFSYFPRRDTLLKGIADHESLQRLLRFSKGFYTIESKNNTIVFNDLRFGQIAGWKYPNADFVFYYYLQHPEDNDLVMQRGRFKGWDREVWISLLEEIKGTNAPAGNRK